MVLFRFYHRIVLFWLYFLLALVFIPAPIIGNGKRDSRAPIYFILIYYNYYRNGVILGNFQFCCFKILQKQVFAPFTVFVGRSFRFTRIYESLVFWNFMVGQRQYAWSPLDFRQSGISFFRTKIHITNSFFLGNASV